MPKICYVPKRFGASALRMIDHANTIIEEYFAQGFDLTLRQLYYQFVSRDLIANTPKEYNRLGTIINDARLAGLIDWNRIVDRTRNLHSLPSWDSPANVIAACAQQFRFDKSSDQDYRIEVWIEKEALAGVFEVVCDELQVPFFACRGYTSQSEMWSAAMRLKRYERDGQIPMILHFGDHDPSGMDMTRDIIDRMRLFMGGMKIERLALNMEQVEQYDPPPNPAKLTDTRATAYIAEYGDESWELDALDPNTLSNLVRDAVAQHRDEEKWDAQIENEEKAKAQLQQVSDNWDEVTKLL